MADAGYAEGRSFNLHSAGTDNVEGSALAIKSSSGAIAVDGVTVGSVNALYIESTVAHDAADAGNPIKIGGKANSNVPTNVADNDRVNAWFGQEGHQIVGAYSAQSGADGFGNTQLAGPLLYQSA